MEKILNHILDIDNYPNNMIKKIQGDDDNNEDNNEIKNNNKSFFEIHNDHITYLMYGTIIILLYKYIKKQK